MIPEAAQKILSENPIARAVTGLILSTDKLFSTNYNINEETVRRMLEPFVDSKIQYTIEDTNIALSQLTKCKFLDFTFQCCGPDRYGFAKDSYSTFFRTNDEFRTEIASYLVNNFPGQRLVQGFNDLFINIKDETNIEESLIKDMGSEFSSKLEKEITIIPPNKELSIEELKTMKEDGKTHILYQRKDHQQATRDETLLIFEHNKLYFMANGDICASRSGGQEEWKHDQHFWIKIPFEPNSTFKEVYNNIRLRADKVKSDYTDEKFIGVNYSFMNVLSKSTIGERSCYMFRTN